MLPKSDIENLLKDLDDLYNSAQSTEHKLYYSKLALLELSGWLESAHDDILTKYTLSKIKDRKYEALLKSEILKKVNGCTYEEHLRIMTIKVVGLINTETLEDKVNSNGDLVSLIGVLKTVWELRRPAAHTSIAGVMPTYNAPSSMLGHLNTLYPLLQHFETELNAL